MRRNNLVGGGLDIYKCSGFEKKVKQKIKKTYRGCRIVWQSYESTSLVQNLKVKLLNLKSQNFECAKLKTLL